MSKPRRSPNTARYRPHCPWPVPPVALALCAALIAVAALPAHGQDEPEPPPVNTGDAFFYAVSDLPYNPDPDLELINGRVGDPREWPASFYSLSGGGRCTSSMVGPRVLLTAAHCVGNGRKVRISQAGRNFMGTCTHSPDYGGNATADWALCLMRREVPGIQYESLNTDAGRLKKDGEVLLTGFGCTRPGGTGGNDGIYRIGESNIARLPKDKNYDIVTKGGAALCFGDSGGPAFLFLDPETKRQRVLISVNSRANIRDTSYLSSVTVVAARTFFDDWSKQNQAQICGLHDGTPSCR